MKEESNQKKLKTGYTTGTCAQAAAKAAAIMLFTKTEVAAVEIKLPKGRQKVFSVLNITFQKDEHGFDSVRCGIKKDSGDDPDVTDKIIVYGTVTYTNGTGIMLDGGKGVGRVTKPGLEQKIGEAAINKIPRKMICREVEEAASFYEYKKGLSVVIDVPDGERLACKTFNPRLGIEGGISILGTSGIVYPMSEQALIDTIEVEIRVKKSDIGPYLLAAPGNYGLDFLEQKYGISPEDAVKCSNYIGETIDFAKEQGAAGLLFAAHIGKFIKIAGGIMNTHSKYADCRMELMACAAMEAGFSNRICGNILSCTTTEGALQLFTEKERDSIMKKVMERIQTHLTARGGDLLIGAIVFSNEYGILGITESAEELMDAFRKQKQKDR